MFALLAQFLHSIRTPTALRLSPARLLMESAEARAGHDPHHAQELREAAHAWLRVVR